ncbi:hypothetical protein GPECTOR_43g958 [Gonium pectorale]|uniref:EngC GTPase domain-containing protein n=1 Tax=Gonium pectorale TaxID=33097 RepID=A0A150G9L0_GONPE|nr:hypothetical protein GPECTOR_43g958 [Gonium pectorale]|eukprot:KXZ46521.1 hypothetical protein GPECTOR_43g958 [Gonium pectorale]
MELTAPPSTGAATSDSSPAAQAASVADLTVSPPTAAPSGPAAGFSSPLRSGLGQVIAAASTYLRVELHELLPDEEPTPPGWRPPHLRDRDPDRDHHPSSNPDSPDSPDADTAAGAAAAAAAWRRPPVLLCSVRALLRKLRQEVVVGDVVRVGSADWRHATGVVTEVLPRSSRLTDPSVANVDHVLLVFALDRPPFEEIQVSRFLVAAEAAGLPFSLVLNKADLVAPEVLQRRLEQCRSWGYQPVVLSCETGEGVEQVAGVLQDRISVVAGPSGAGKSSLINSLRLGRHRPDLPPADPRIAGSEAEPGQESDFDLDQEGALRCGGEGASGSVSAAGSESEGEPGADSAAETESSSGRGGGVAGRAAGATSRVGSVEGAPDVGSLSKIGRGMHTTTTVRLLRLRGGGWLADTPGFGQPTLDEWVEGGVWMFR